MVKLKINLFSIFVCCIQFLLTCCLLKKIKKQKFRYILQLFFDKGENEIQEVEIVTGVYGTDTISATAIYV